MVFQYETIRRHAQLHKDAQYRYLYRKLYLTKINDKELYAYNVYQIEGEGRSLFSKIEGDESTIMGLPINQIKEYLSSFK